MYRGDLLTAVYSAAASQNISNPVSSFMAKLAVCWISSQSPLLDSS